MIEPFVFVGVPVYDNIAPEAIDGLACASSTIRWYRDLAKSSVLPHGFDMLWETCLNNRNLGFTHFAMHHSDIQSPVNWLDMLYEEMERVGADLISVVSPIKDDRGLTSSGLRRSDCSIRRFTMKEIMRLPETFTQSDLLGLAPIGETGQLMVNTGLWLCRLGPWVDKFPGFAMLTAIDTELDGKKKSKMLPEDWNFSRWLAENNIRVFLTRKVSIDHWGRKAFNNREAWGTWETDLGDGAPIVPAEKKEEVAVVSSVEKMSVVEKPASNQSIIVMNRAELEKHCLDEKTALISFTDPELPPVVAPFVNVIARLDIRCRDVSLDCYDLSPPIHEDAQKVLAFAQQHWNVPRLIIQCEAGVGRSMAVAAALYRICGNDDRTLRRQGAYHRRLYRMILDAAKQPIPAEPLVSLAVRVKYPLDRLAAFLFSTQRQRYENWEMVAVVDGLAPRLLHEDTDFSSESRLLVAETTERKGRWGHPWRQFGIDKCQGDIIGINNDDNYLTPGYIEQLVQALEDENALIAYCDCLHAYHGWAVAKGSVTGGSTDLGCWLARRELLDRVKWEGDDFLADGRFFRRLVETAGNRVAYVPRPLLVKN